jgi:hypothetical protein
VSCFSEDGRVVIAYQFYDAGALENQTSFESTFVTDPGSCELGQPEVSQWYYTTDVSEGDLVCSVDDQSFFIYWTYDSALVGFLVLDDATNGAALYEWWRTFEGLQR